MRILAVLFLACACAGAARAAPATEPAGSASDRFALRAHFEHAPEEAGSSRFSVHASARLAGSDSRRFLVQSVSASCATAADLIFMDGFEPATP